MESEEEKEREREGGRGRLMRAAAAAAVMREAASVAGEQPRASHAHTHADRQRDAAKATQISRVVNFQPPFLSESVCMCARHSSARNQQEHEDRSCEPLINQRTREEAAGT